MALSSRRLAILAFAIIIATVFVLIALGSVVAEEQAGGRRAGGQVPKAVKVVPRPPIPADAAAEDHVQATHAAVADHHPAAAVTTPAASVTAATLVPPALTPQPIPAEVAFAPSTTWAQSMWTAIQKARTAPRNEIVPMIITPMFHDGDVLPNMLNSINVPVRHFYFIWNSNDQDIANIVTELRRFPYGVSVAHNPDNFGFSASINHGLRLGLTWSREDCPWYWVINCDVSFPPQTMPEMVKRTYETDLDTKGMMYGPGIDHYAFIVTRRAVEVAGLMDENFYPAYFEDVDWRWRVNLAGFEEIVFHLPVNHIRSHNLKKGADPRFMQMHHRHGNGWPYGAMKWGEIRQHLIHERYPPSGWKNPFGIDMPLDKWVIDEERLHCIKTGQGDYHPRTGHCWYHGYKVLAPHLKNGTWFPLCMKQPYPDAFQPR